MPVRTPAASTGGSRTESLGPIAKAMQKSMNEALKIPHFGYNEEYDVTNLVELRKVLKPLAAEYGIKLSYMPFIIKVSFLIRCLFADAFDSRLCLSLYQKVRF